MWVERSKIGYQMCPVRTKSCWIHLVGYWSGKDLYANEVILGFQCLTVVIFNIHTLTDMDMGCSPTQLLAAWLILTQFARFHGILFTDEAKSSLQVAVCTTCPMPLKGLQVAFVKTQKWLTTNQQQLPATVSVCHQPQPTAASHNSWCAKGGKSEAARSPKKEQIKFLASP